MPSDEVRFLWLISFFVGYQRIAQANKSDSLDDVEDIPSQDDSNGEKDKQRSFEKRNSGDFNPLNEAADITEGNDDKKVQADMFDAMNIDNDTEESKEQQKEKDQRDLKDNQQEKEREKKKRIQQDRRRADMKKQQMQIIGPVVSSFDSFDCFLFISRQMATYVEEKNYNCLHVAVASLKELVWDIYTHSHKLDSLYWLWHVCK